MPITLADALLRIAERELYRPTRQAGDEACPLGELPRVLVANRSSSCRSTRSIVSHRSSHRWAPGALPRPDRVSSTDRAAAKAAGSATGTRSYRLLAINCRSSLTLSHTSAYQSSRYPSPGAALGQGTTRVAGPVVVGLAKCGDGHDPLVAQTLRRNQWWHLYWGPGAARVVQVGDTVTPSGQRFGGSSGLVADARCDRPSAG